MVQLESVYRLYGTKRALDDVSLEIPRGAVLRLAGANGAGKTTLIKHVLGLLRAKRGQIRVFGLDPLRREILEAAIRSIVGEGLTVLFSSHLLDEIVRMADRVAWRFLQRWSENA